MQLWQYCLLTTTSMLYIRCALYYSMAKMGLDQSHFGYGIVQCAPTLTSVQGLFLPNS